MLCGCMKVTTEDVVAAIENGAKSFEEVQEVTKISTGCGGCKEKNQAVINELLAK